MGKRTGTYVGSTIIVMLLLLGALFVVATGTVSAAHDGDYTYSIGGDVATITGYTGTGGEITIPSALGGYTVGGIGDWAFANLTSLTSVTIPTSVTYIEWDAFASCTSLTSITFYGLVAPTTVGSGWIDNIPMGIRGHAYANSTFPAPGEMWNGLTIGDVIPFAKVATTLTLLCNSTSYIGDVNEIYGMLKTISGALVVNRIVHIDITRPIGTHFTHNYVTDANGNITPIAWVPIAAGTYIVVGSFAGDSQYLATSASINFTAIEKIPATVPSEPLGLQAQAGKSLVVLNWTAPINLGPGNITYHLFRDGSEIWSGTDITYQDAPLTKGVQYSYTVAAQNSIGWGPNCTEVLATPYGVPDAPTGFNATAGNGIVSLNWTAPAYLGPGSVYYHLFRDQILIWNGTALTYLDTPLIKNVSYSYNVVAQNDIGWGANSTMILATPFGVPDSPWGLNGIPGDLRSSVSWNAVNYSGPGILTYHLFRDGALVWSGSEITYDDVGLNNGQAYEYSVVASNSVGWSSNSSSIVIIPQGLPTEPLGFEANAGDEMIELNWTAPSYSGPGTITYHLFRDGSEIWNGTTLTYLDTPLMKNVSYSYNVAAQNSVGWGPNCSEVLVTPYGVPDAPTGLRGISGDGTVSLNWTAPGYLGPGTIIYHLFRDQILIWNGTGTNYTDVSVTNGITYTYEVSANNSIGWGENSTSVQAKPMSAEQEPTAPRNLTAIAGFENVTLTWEAPAYSNASAVSGYLISYGTSPYSLTNHITWNQLVYVLIGLTKGQAYYFNVAAQNNAGWGLNSSIISATPFGVPSIPLGFRAMAGDANVTLNWTAPSYLGPGTIMYHLFRDGSEVWSGTGLTYSDTGVTNGITYSYQLAASNSVGWGENGTAVQATPQRAGSVPLAPRGLTATAGNWFVELNWTVPLYIGPGTITYHLFRDGTLVWNGVITTHNDTGLNNGQTYEYKVAASNSVGWSSNSSSVSAMPQGSPSAPRGLTASPGNDFIELNWTTPSYAGHGTLIYHLFRDGVEVWSGTVITHKDTGLTNGQVYVYQVVASNSADWGRISASVQATPIAQGDNTLLYIGIGAIAVVLFLVAVQLLRKREKTIPPKPNPPMQATPTDISQIFHCEYCGMQMPADLSICPYCGTKVNR